MFIDPTGTKPSPTNNWLEVFLYTLAECAKVLFVFERTGDYAAFDYPDGYNKLINKNFDWGNILGKFGDGISIGWTLGLTAAEEVGALATSYAIQIPAVLFNFFGTALNDILSNPEKTTFYVLNSISVATPIVLTVLGLLNVWNPGGWAVLTISGGVFAANTLFQNIYTSHLQDLLHSII